jgi:DNA mismatch repair protein MutL
VSGRIHVLDAALADQIAAGEVVERPASVVKELVDNAIDAGATRITVDVQDAGRARIRVADDGSGMDAEDATLAVRRHATSKLRTEADLSAIATLGFRGEALPAIASVSRFSLVTRTRDSVGGTRVEIDGGGDARIAPAGCAPGTTVEVRDLFHNVPARLKFLKSRAAEAGHVAAVCTRAALAHPGVGVTLVADGRTLRELPPAASLSERARTVFPHEPLVDVAGESGAIRVRAALGPPERARAGATGLQLIINGRPVRDPSLARAVVYAYGSVIPPGRYPVGVVAIDLPLALVDVNVHPQKAEVRFADGRALFDAVMRVLARQLGASAWGAPPRTASYWDARLGPPSEIAERVADRASADPWDLAGAPDSPPGTGEAVGGMEDAWLAEDAAGSGAGWRVLGQVRRMLIVCEGDGALHVVDQHAADERVRFDRLRRAYTERTVQGQRLLFPERVEVSESEAAALDAHRADLERLGLECVRLGPGTIAVHAVPALVSRAAPNRLVRDVLDELSRTGERAFGDAVDTALATMACHGAIRAGDVLSREEAHALVANLRAIDDFAGHCPHGRPIVHRIALDEIERRLGR